MKGAITRTSTLRPLAELIEAINHDWPTSTSNELMTKAAAESKLLQVVGVTINRDLAEIDSLYCRQTHDAIAEVALELAIEDSLRAAPEQQVSLKEIDVIRMLMKPVPPALILERVARALETEMPDVVKKAVSAMRTAD